MAKKVGTVALGPLRYQCGHVGFQEVACCPCVMAVSMDTVNLKGVTDGHFVVVKGKQTGIVAQKLKTKILVVFNKILEKFH